MPTHTSTTTTTEFTTWQLARLADVADPDTNTSPGAKFLHGIADSVDEAKQYGTDDDTVFEIADGAVPIYTKDVWATFVDLGAYTEDISEFGPITDMEQAAKTALFMIGERLAAALLDRS